MPDAEHLPQEPDRSVLPIPDPAFTGTSNLTLEGSVPDWGITAAVQPPPGAPNVLLVMIDDTGFANPTTFGGVINTPTLDRLAADGLKYNRFQVCALCSPTRAAMLTGRNHHRVGFGSISEFAAPFPGYSANLPQSCAPVSKLLQLNGYSTAAFGKWHLTPNDQQGAAGPVTRWPSGWGFDHFWGFLGGEAGQFDPVITQDNTVIGVPESTDGHYYLPDDQASKTIEWIHQVRAVNPDRPYFIYYSTGAAHAPHQVPPEWSDRYAGKFDEGWDRYRENAFARQKELGIIPADTELTPRPDAMPAWDSLTPDLKRLYARQMEVFAGFQENADWNLGRVIDAITEMGELDNTVIICVWGDNGASMEGTTTGSFNELTMQNGIPLTDQEQLELTEEHGGIEAWGTDRMEPHYACAWAWAGNTPFRWGKQVACYLGGTQVGMVVRWPGLISDPGGLRSQFTHCIDIAPTILEIVRLPEAKSVNGIAQERMQGTSFAYTFGTPGAIERHNQQYFEIYGNLGMYDRGWWASQMLPRIPWDVTPETMNEFRPGVYDPSKYPWELYYLPDDYSQARNLAAQYPDRLDELKALFFRVARENYVTPLLAGFATFFGILPSLGNRTKYTYYQDVQNILPGSIPPIYGRSYTISADLEIPGDGADGVIIAEAAELGGFSLFVQDNTLKYTYSMLGVRTYRQRASRPLPTGRVTVRMVFTADENIPGTPGTAELFYDHQLVSRMRMDNTVPVVFTAYAGMDIGRDNGLPVDQSYACQSPFPFTGVIRKVEIEIPPIPDGPVARRLYQRRNEHLVGWAI
ncbi:MAG TPA: arylsulfatase, partial [Pseudonocardiaceae bacterium]|nr:arylsulfatase [Pseudonocardiaceae bacterium]